MLIRCYLADAKEQTEAGKEVIQHFAKGECTYGYPFKGEVDVYFRADGRGIYCELHGYLDGFPSKLGSLFKIACFSLRDEGRIDSFDAPQPGEYQNQNEEAGRAKGVANCVHFHLSSKDNYEGWQVEVFGTSWDAVINLYLTIRRGKAEPEHQWVSGLAMWLTEQAKLIKKVGAALGIDGQETDKPSSELDKGLGEEVSQ